MENEIIIIGGNHYNTLGVIRSLGEKKVKSNLIITNNDRYAYIVKSKYVKKYDIVKEDETIIKKILIEKYSKFDKKAILVPTSDFAALFIDKNLDELKKFFIVPNIKNTQSEIEKMMNKFNQYLLAQKYKIKMAKSVILDLSKNEKIDKLPIPCILKPLTSALGQKTDIEICKTKDELKKTIKNLKNKNYSTILLQEFLDYDYECSINGCCYDKLVIVPAIIKKIRIYPLKRGSTCYGKIIKLENFDIDISNIIKMLKEMKYQGLYDIDFFIKNKTLYLNEINFRIGANNYSTNYGNVNLVYLWILLALNKDVSNENTLVDKEYYFQSEFFDIKHVKDKNLSLKEFINFFLKSKVHLFFNKKDLKPMVYKFFYAIFKRINKNY